jgi:hypothetical protein
MMPLFLSLVLRVALAGPPLAGVPLDELGALGLLAPTTIDGEDAWRAPLAAGPGWVLYRWAPDEAAAAADAAFLRGSVQRVLPAVVVAGADEAWGDPGFVTARRANVTVQVRAADALQLAAKLLAAAEPTPVTGAAPVDGRDAYGRRVGEPAR